jgi:hypothetical protein
MVRMGDIRNAYRILMEKPLCNRQLGRTRKKLEDNIEMDVTEFRL